MAVLTPDPTLEKHAPPVRPDGSVHLTGDLSTKDPGVFGSLVESFRDVFFPPKLPPLVLESKPIAVVDRMAVKRDPKSTAIATIVNGSLLALAIWWGARKIVETTAPKNPVIIVMDQAPPPKLAPKKEAAGGGGGQKGPTPVTKGNPPKFEKDPILPPKAPPLEQPKFKFEPAVQVPQDVKMAKSDLPNIGMSNSPLVGPASMGNGNGNGIGPGNGNGYGPGSDKGIGGGVYRPGTGGVSAPKVLFAPEPEFSEEARKAKVAGNVLVYLQVDPTGKPIRVRVLRGIGMGLDQKAVEAVQQYKFTPAMKDGKPVTVEMNVEVNFQIF